jgi:hypothetical protein
MYIGSHSNTRMPKIIHPNSDEKNACPLVHAPSVCPTTCDFLDGSQRENVMCAVESLYRPRPTHCLCSGIYQCRDERRHRRCIVFSRNKPVGNLFMATTRYEGITTHDRRSCRSAQGVRYRFLLIVSMTRYDDEGRKNGASHDDLHALNCLPPGIAILERRG